MNEEKLPDIGLEVGDLVEGYGSEGEVTAADNCLSYPTITVWFKHADITRWFLPDGSVESWHKIPSLKLIEKKIKPKRKVTLYRYTHVYDHSPRIYQSDWSTNKTSDFVILKTETKEIEID